MKILRTLMLLVLLGAVLPLRLGAQTTETFSFTTNRLVPDGNAAGLSDARMVNSAVGVISSVTVGLQVTGEFNGDLYGYLKHASGYTVLLNRSGMTATNVHGYADNGLNVTFQANAANGDIHVYENVTTPAAGTPLTGAWQPDGRNADPTNVLDTAARSTSLTNFTGLNAAGEWTLYLADMESGGTNMLTGWSLQISGAAYPTLAWGKPADIVYGGGLSATQLNATATYDSTNVPGTLTYTPALGTVLSAGSNQTLSVTFTPSNTNDFLPITTNVTINVQQAALYVTADNTNSVYGSALPGFTASYSGFVNGDTAASLTTPVTLGTPATASSPVGTYTITASGAADANYSFSYVTGTLTVTTAALTITANNTNSVYGSALPVFTASYSGFVNGDTAASLTTPVTLGTPATASSPVGTYTITASGAADANYSFSYVSGTLTVTPAMITVAADNKTKAYGASLPALTATYTGFVLGQTTNDLTGLAALTTTATTNSPVGSYPISASGASSPNYSFTYVPGTMSVTAVTITVTADDKAKAYGEALPALTATYSGFALGEGTNNLTGLATLTTTATATSDVGAYPITPSGAASPNYAFTYVAGTLTITQAVTSGSIVSSANPALPGANVTFTMTVSAVAPGAGIPSGNVNFRVDGSVAGSSALSGGAATMSLTNLSHGTHAVIAEYAGNNDFIGITNSLTPVQTINTPPVANNVTIQRYPTQGVKVRLSALLGIASDADGDSLNISVSSTSANGGAITVSGDWVFFAPAAGFTSADTYTYTVTDQYGGSATGAVNVAIEVDTAAGQNLVVSDLDNGSVLISGSGIPDRTYRMQYATVASPTVWQDLAGSSVTADNSGAFQFTDASGVGGRLYRSVYP